MKTTKDAVEHYKGVWDIGEHKALAFSQTHGWTSCWEGSSYLVCTKQQFEDYVRDNKMDKQYKYVNAGIKTVGQLVDGLDNEVDYFLHGEPLHILTINCAILHGEKTEPFSLAEIKGFLQDIKTRQPMPWWKIDGALPAAGFYNHKPVFIESYFTEDGVDWLSLYGGKAAQAGDVEPMCKDRAARYGV